MKSSARILLFDLEVSPNLAWAYGKWQTNLIKIKEYSTLMSFSWKWYGANDDIKHASLVNIPRKGKTSSNAALVKLLHNLFDEADVVVAHNANGFDVKMANAFFIRHGLKPPSPYKVVDTLRVARGSFKFPGGNSLDELGKYLGVGVKAPVGVGSLWYDCLKGDPKAWKLMEEYNNQDVVVLEGLYEKMLPYIRNHPNLGDILQRDGVCPKCGSTHLQKRGYNHRRNGKTQRYQCMGCKGWTNEAKLNAKGRLVNA